MGKLWSVSEVAEAAGADPSYVRRLVAHGRIEGQKAGRTWVIGDDAARRWIEAYILRHAEQSRLDEVTH